MEPRKYKQPPIEEALCEFRFAPDSGWDFTVPGKLATELASAYPKTKQQQETSFVVATLPGSQPNIAVQQGFGRVQLVSADDKKLIALSQDVISIHVMRPYPGWSEFRPRIEEALTRYVRVTRATSIERIGVRYVNRIRVPGDGTDASTYFALNLQTFAGLPRLPKAFLHRDEYASDDITKVVITHATIDAASGTTAFLLDVDVIHEGKPLSVAEAMSRVDALKVVQRAVFEAAVTDSAREVFDG